MSELKVKFLMGPAECNDRNIPAYSEEFLGNLSEALGEQDIILWRLLWKLWDFCRKRG